jgi:hypothetical protein
MADENHPKPAPPVPLAPPQPLPGPSQVEHITITKGLIPPLKRPSKS